MTSRKKFILDFTRDVINKNITNLLAMPKDTYLPKCRSAIKVTWTNTCKNPEPVQNPATPEVNRSRDRRQYESGRAVGRPMVHKYVKQRYAKRSFCSSCYYRNKQMLIDNGEPKPTAASIKRMSSQTRGSCPACEAQGTLIRMCPTCYHAKHPNVGADTVSVNRRL